MRGQCQDNVTATLGGGYGPDVQTSTVVLSDTIRQDFNLPAGWLSHAPSGLEVTLSLGTSTPVPLTLTNTGGLPAALELQEQERDAPPLGAVQGRGEWLYRSEKGERLSGNRGKGKLVLAHPQAYHWQPAQLSTTLNILIYADDPEHPAPNTFLDQALQHLGLAYTAHYDGDWAGFEADLTSGAWDLVLVGDDNELPPASTLTALNNYVISGGKLVFHGWTVGGDPSNPLWATLGFTWVTDDVDPPSSIYWWEPGHPVFTSPESVPEFTSLTDGIYSVYGQHGEPLAGFQALAGYTTPGPDPNQAALILGNDGRTVFKGFLDGHNSANLDGGTLMDGVELWINLIEGLLTSFSADMPWLSEAPATGTIALLSDQVIDVTFDASVPEITQPGQYLAQLRISDDTPYSAATMPARKEGAMRPQRYYQPS